MTLPLIFLPLLLASVPLSQSQEYGLQDGYLPPCETTTSTTTAYNTVVEATTVTTRKVVTVPTTVFRSTVRRIESITTRTKVAYTTITRTSYVPRQVYRTTTVTVPGSTAYVTRPIYQTIERTTGKIAYSTIYKTEVQPKYVTIRSTTTAYRTSTDFVDRPRTVFTTEYISSNPTTVYKMIPKVSTAVEYIKQTTTQTKINTEYTTSTIYRELPGPVITKATTQLIRRTQYTTVPKLVTITQTVTSTVTNVIPTYVTRINTIYRTIVDTVVKTVKSDVYTNRIVYTQVTKPIQVEITQTREVTKPAYTSVVTRYTTSTSYTAVIVPGRTKIVPVIRRETKTKIQLRQTTQYVTKTITQSKPCGYKYTQPSNPLFI